MQQATEEWLYGVKAIAGHVGVSRATVERWLADESSGCPAFRVGGRWVAISGEVVEWLRRRVKRRGVRDFEGN